jgi:hypothetical protein
MKPIKCRVGDCLVCDRPETLLLYEKVCFKCLANKHMEGKPDRCRASA